MRSVLTAKTIPGLISGIEKSSVSTKVRNSDLEKHTTFFIKNYFKDTLIEIVFFIKLSCFSYLLFLYFTLLILSCLILPYFIFDFFGYARAYVRTGSYAPERYRVTLIECTYIS